VPAKAYLVAVVSIAMLAFAACRAGAPSGGAGASPQPTGGSCTLSPTGALQKVTFNGPGPGGATVPRSYERYVPAGVSSASKLPLLVSLHGTGANGAIQASLTHWTSFADSLAGTGGAFISVFPDGLNTVWFWGAEKSYDAAFVFDVIAEVRLSQCIDPTSIFIDGWSEGAYMAQRMACSTGDASVNRNAVKLAAVHGYAGGDPDVSGKSCTAPAITRVLLSQGLDDTIIDPQRLGFPAYLAWGRRYGCGGSPQTLTAVQQISGCGHDAQVAWWPIAGQGHLAWSCSAKPTWHNQGVWAFFTSRLLPPGSVCG